MQAVDLAKETDFALERMAVRPSASEVEVDGAVHRLEPRVMRMLVALARAKGAVVSRDELIQTCWDGVIVGDDAINRIASRLRRLAESISPSPFRLETIPKVGYRLVAAATASAVTNAPEAAAQPSATTARGPRLRRKRLVFGALAAGAMLVLVVGILLFQTFSRTLTVRPPVIVAVLPFENFSADPAFRYFAGGVSVEVHGALVEYAKDIVVLDLAQTSKFPGEPAQAVGRKVGATHVITGSVRREGPRVRIIAQLVAAADGAILWTNTSERHADFELDAQTDVARGVAVLMKEWAYLLQPGPGQLSSAALRRFLQAQFAKDTQTGIADLEATVRLAPYFARGWAELAMARARLSRKMNEAEQTAMVKSAREALDAALKLDPDLPTAIAVEVRLEPGWNWKAKYDGLMRARELAPEDALVLELWADFLYDTGRLEERRKVRNEMQRLSPLLPDVRRSAITDELAAGNSAKALQMIEYLIARDEHAVDMWWPYYDNRINAFDLPGTRKAMAELEKNWAVIARDRGWSMQQAEWQLEEFRRDLRVFEKTGMNAKNMHEDVWKKLADGEFVKLDTIKRGQGCAADEMPYLPSWWRPDLGFEMAKELYHRRGYVGTTDSCSVPVYPERQAPTWPLFTIGTLEMRLEPRIWDTFTTVGLSQFWLETGRWPDFCSKESLPYDCKAAAEAAVAAQTARPPQ